jgi:saccharopine dehydrogenase-like NADP-dependent oxidoreductase
MTAIPAVVAAIMLARGQVAGPGVVPPEEAFDAEGFVRAVRRAGVKVATTVRSVDGTRL